MKRILITGASRGIGRAIATKLAAAGTFYFFTAATRGSDGNLAAGRSKWRRNHAAFL